MFFSIHATAASRSTDCDSLLTALPTTSWRFSMHCSQSSLATKSSCPVMHAKFLAFCCRSAPDTGVLLALISKNQLNTASLTASKAAARSFIQSPLTPCATVSGMASLLLKMVDSVLNDKVKFSGTFFLRRTQRLSTLPTSARLLNFCAYVYCCHCLSRV